MSGDDFPSPRDRHGVAKSAVRSRVDGIAWALLFIWVGIAILADFGWGWFLVGIGLIILGAQAALWRDSEALDGVWIVCGAVFFIGGVWQVLGLTWPLAPILLMLLGVAILWRALFSPPDGRL